MNLFSQIQKITYKKIDLLIRNQEMVDPLNPDLSIHSSDIMSNIKNFSTFLPKFYDYQNNWIISTWDNLDEDDNWSFLDTSLSSQFKNNSLFLQSLQIAPQSMSIESKNL